MNKREKIIIQNMIINKIKNCYCHETRISEAMEKWGEKEFKVISDLIGVSVTTSKRIFCHSYYQPQNYSHKVKTAIANFLNFSNWNDLEEQIIMRELEIEGITSKVDIILKDIKHLKCLMEEILKKLK